MPVVDATINGRNQIGGRSSMIVTSDGRARADVWLQDQYTDVVDRFLTRKLGEATLALPTAFDDRTITLQPGHNFVGGDMIEIDDGTKRQYQSRVMSVTGDVLTVVNPLCFAYDTTANVKRVTQDGNVDGSVTPIVFSMFPPAGVQWDINILAVNMLDNKVMDDGKFGGLAAPIPGVVYRVVNDNCNNIFTAVDNSCYIRHCDWAQYSDRAPSGQYGFNAKRYFNGQSGDGVSIRIGGSEVHRFEMVIAANLTGLDRFWNVIRGHVVE